MWLRRKANVNNAKAFNVTRADAQRRVQPRRARNNRKQMWRPPGAGCHGSFGGESWHAISFRSIDNYIRLADRKQMTPSWAWVQQHPNISWYS
jgi:hypothetical protein